METDEEGWLLLGETVRETDPGPWALVGDTDAWVLLGLNTIVVKIPDAGEVAGETVLVAAAAGEEGCVVLGETVRETDPEPWALVGDTEAWVLLGIVARITDAGEVADETVVVEEDDISKDAKENEKQN